MPEGDTVWHTATKLREALAGKTLTRCDVRVPRYATVDLTGQQVDEVVSRGKHLFIRVGQASIHSHLKMDGSWQVNPVGRPSRAGHRIRIILEAGDVQAAGIDLGVLEILERDRDEEAVAHLGPDLLGDDWDPQTAAANLVADPDRPLAEALLDQRVMAGVGNVYCNELCFVFGHLPTAPVSEVTDPLRMVQRARDMLWLNRSRSNRTTTGDTRRGQQVWVYGRAGEPCRRCGTSIKTDRTGDRVAFWCPNCQRRGQGLLALETSAELCHSGAMAEPDPITVLTEEESWSLLAGVTLGRVVTTAAGKPEIFPVNFVAKRPTVLFKTAPGTKLLTAAMNREVAFEADDHSFTEGWSVIVRGIARVLSTSADIEKAERAQLLPWIPTLKPYYVSIDVSEISGRRFTFGSEPDPESTFA